MAAICIRLSECEKGGGGQEKRRREAALPPKFRPYFGMCRTFIVFGFLYFYPTIP